MTRVLVLGRRGGIAKQASLLPLKLRGTKLAKALRKGFLVDVTAPGKGKVSVVATRAGKTVAKGAARASGAESRRPVSMSSRARAAPSSLIRSARPPSRVPRSSSRLPGSVPESARSASRSLIAPSSLAARTGSSASRRSAPRSG